MQPDTDDTKFLLRSFLNKFNSPPKRKCKAIPVTGRGGPKDCETLRLPHFLDNRFTDGGKVVSLTRRPPFTPRKDFCYSFLLEAESTPGS
jgi:hypothetical protein